MAPTVEANPWGTPLPAEHPDVQSFPFTLRTAPTYDNRLFGTPAKAVTSNAPLDTPSRTATESPSARLIREIGLQTVDYHKDLHSRLDQRTLEKERAHLEALTAAALEHERIRRAAQRAQERISLEAEKERLQREEEESKELLRDRQETVERDIARRRREMDETRLLEERKRAAEEATRLAEEEQRERLRKVQEEERKRKQAASEEETRRLEDAAKARELVEAKPSQNIASASSSKRSLQAQPAVSNAVKPVQVTTEITSGLVSSMATRKASHEQYVALHQRLKDMRRFVMERVKQDSKLKGRIGDMRREIKKSVGQLTGEKGANRNQIKKIRDLLMEASQMTLPMLDVKLFILSIPPQANNSTNSQIPGPLIYLLNMLSKYIISQFIDEAGVMPKAADPIGVVAVSMFAQPEFRWNGTPLIDILLAKFHVVCPILWGVYGDDKTEGGRKALGWWRESPGGPWVSEQRHSERMTGLGSGFAALAMRDFSKSKNQNPFPPSHYWHAMACIVNTPTHQVTQTHFFVLKAMIDNYIPRFIGFYGQAAKAALRRAIVDFPQQSSKNVAASGLATLAVTIKRDLQLTL